MSKVILHVDDEPEIREILQIALGGRGHRVISAASAMEAEKFVESERPDLIIADMQLSDRDGLEMIRDLRIKLPDVPVALLTGVLIDPRVARKSLGREVDCYLSKTTPLQQIIAEAERLMGLAAK